MSGIRLMRILTRPNLGGPTRQAIALWHAHRALGLATLLVTGRVGDDEEPLCPADFDVPRLTLDAVRRAGPAAAGWVEVSELGRGMHPLRDRRALACLRELIAVHRPDVVHTHTSKAGWLGRRAALAAGVRKVVHTFHGHVLRDYFAGPLSRWLAWMEQRLALRTHELVAVSPSCADELAELGIAPRQRFHIVPPAVELATPTSRAVARQQLGIAKSERRIVAVGRFVPIKRLADFVSAVAADPALRGDLVGSGPEAPALARQIARAAAGRIELRAATPAIRGQLSAYDALLLPSRREGCPLVAIEAFAAGVPVIGYDVPGVRDVLAEWGRGVLVPEAKGPAGLLAAFHRLEGSADLRQRCLDESRSGLGRFAPAEVARGLSAVYGCG